MGTKRAPRARWPRAYVPAILTLLMGLALTAAAFAATRILAGEQTKDEFERRSGNMLNTLASGVSGAFEVLRSIRSFFAASELVTREEFHRYVQEPLALHPYIQAFEWVPRISAAERARFEAAASAVYGTDFQLLEFGSGGRFVPAGPRAEYFPVFYVEPFGPNRATLGVDLGSNAARRTAIEQAAASGRATATSWLRLIQGGDGFLVFLPVEVGRPPRAPYAPLRPERASGFAAGVFRLAALIQGALQPLDEPIDFFLYETDAAPGARTIFRYDAHTQRLVPVAELEVPAEIPPGFVRYDTIRIAGRRWNLLFYPTPRFLEAAETREPWLILGSGVLLTALVSLLLVTQARRTAEIAEVNRTLAVEARQRRRVQQDLRASEKHSRFLAEASAALVSSLDYETTLRTVARLAVAEVAQWCIVHILQPDGTVRRLELAAADPELERRIRAVVERYPPSLGREDGPLATAIRTRRPQFIADLTPERITALARDPEQAQAFLEVEPRSLLTVPLVARGRTMGTITFATTGENRLDRGDVALAEELARRAAVAVDNSRLFADAQAASQAKSDFLAVMSHELRTPLNAIMGFADLLLMGVAGPLEDAQKRQVERISASARHLLELIEEILSFSRMQEGAGPIIRSSRAELGRVLKELAAGARADAKAKGLEFRLEVPDEPVEFATDPIKLGQAVGNVLGNAVKFTDHGRVELRGWQADERIYIQVEDTGIGITPEQQRHLFEPFWQAEAPMTRRAGGTGLGLPVARRLIRLLGGDITVESKPGAGSTFTIELPREHAERTRTSGDSG